MRNQNGYAASAVEIWAAALLFVAIGAAMAWSYWQFEKESSIADAYAALFAAIAAAGTWAVGIGANRYAQAAQHLQESVAKRNAQELERQAASQIRHIVVWMKIAQQPIGALGELVDEVDGDEPPDMAATHGAVAATRDVLRNIKWDSDAWMRLDEEGIEAKIRIEAAVRAYEYICHLYMEQHDLDGAAANQLLDPDEQGFQLLQHGAAEIFGMANVVHAAVARFHEEAPSPPVPRNPASAQGGAAGG